MIKDKNIKIHLWAPNMFGFKGGIQRFSKFLYEALLASKYEVIVHLKLDKAESVPKEFDKVHSYGDWPRFIQTIIFSFGVMIGVIRDKPKLIISTHINFGPVAFLLSLITRTPYWLVAHGVDAWEINGLFRRLAFRKASKILAVSQFTREKILEDKRINPNLVETLYNTFDENRFTISEKSSFLLEKYSIKPDAQIILTVCRFDSRERYKGYDLVLRSLNRLRDDFPNLHYLVVGGGDDLERFKGDVNKYGLDCCVTTVGVVSDELLPRFYQLCDVFALPSRGEGFGIVYLEALASGKPVIGGNMDGARDALCHGDLGALINPLDEDELIQVTSKILRKEYENSLVYKSDDLRKETIKRFGKAAFQIKISQLLEERGEIIQQ